MSTGLAADLRALLAIRRFIGLRPAELVRPIAAGALTLAAALTLTVVSAWLITKSWQMPPVLDLTVAVTAVRALGISRAVFRYLDRLASHDLALRCAERARVAAYRALAAGSPERTVRLGRGALLTRVGADVDMVADVIVRAVVPAGVSLVVSVSAVAFTALLSPAAAAVLAVGLLVAGVGAPWATARAARLAEAARGGAVEAHVTAVDRVLADAPALRIRGDLGDALADADRASRRLADADEAGAPAEATGSAITTIANGLTVVFVILVAMVGYVDVVGAEALAGVGAGAGALANGGTAGAAATAGSALTNIHSPQWLGVLALLPLAAFEAVAALPSAAVAVTRAAGAARRLGEFTGAGGPVEEAEGGPSESKHGADTGPADSLLGDNATPRLRATGLVTGFDRDLGTWDLDLPFGARETIVAPSGSGKTTLLLTLAGLLPRRGGDITIDFGDGRGPTDIDRVPAEKLRATVRFIAEDDHVFATSVRENLALGAPDATDDDMHRVLDAVGLGDWVGGLPHGIGTVLTTGADSISGGQRRRLLLARALLTDAPILLLDEPAEHLDDAGTARLLDLLGDDDGGGGDVSGRDVNDSDVNGSDVSPSDGSSRDPRGAEPLPTDRPHRDDRPLPGALAKRTIIVVRHPRQRP